MINSTVWTDDHNVIIGVKFSLYGSHAGRPSRYTSNIEHFNGRRSSSHHLK